MEIYVENTDMPDQNQIKVEGMEREREKKTLVRNVMISDIGIAVGI